MAAIPVRDGGAMGPIHRITGYEAGGAGEGGHNIRFLIKSRIIFIDKICFPF